MRALRAALAIALAAVLVRATFLGLGTRTLAASILAAFLVGLVATRAGAPFPSEGRPIRGADALTGALAALLALAIAFAVVLLAGGASRGRPALAVATVVFGLFEAVAAATRDEILFRWMPLRLGEGLAPARALDVFAVLLGMAPLFGTGARPSALLVAAGLGVLSVVLVRRTGNLTASVAMHAVVIYATATVLPSIDLRLREGTLVPLARASGAIAWVLGGALLACAAALARPSVFGAPKR